MIKNKVARIISTYSADTFGVCSMLMHLGGMIVIHDPSGCNSTYTTHDEPRWFSSDGQLFISGLTERDAILGNEDKLFREIVSTVSTAKKFNKAPKFIALLGSPVPFLIGFDFHNLAKKVFQATNIQTIFFPVYGMNDYVAGISLAGEFLANQVNDSLRAENKNANEKISVNLLGAAPLDFSKEEFLQSIVDWLQENYFSVQSIFSMTSSFEKMQTASQAQVNLVLSAGGFSAAKILYQKFQIPFVVGVPFAQKNWREKILFLLKKAAETKKNFVAYKPENFCECFFKDLKIAHAVKTNEPALQENFSLFVGESVWMQSLACALDEKISLVLCPVCTHQELLNSNAHCKTYEKEILPYFLQAKKIFADGLYEPLVSKNQKFILLAHEAFSGRLYRDDSMKNPNLFSSEIFQNFQEKIN